MESIRNELFRARVPGCFLPRGCHLQAWPTQENHRRPRLTPTAAAAAAHSQTLKIVRYTTQLLLATALAGRDDELTARLRSFEKSIGTSRKAYRLGKFLGNVDTLRKTRVHAPFAALECVAAGGECVYYFTEQLIWLVKAGLLPDRYSRQLARVSAYGELAGYAGSISLCLVRISLLLEREVALLAELERQQAAAAADGGSGGSDTSAKALAAEIRLMRSRRVLRTLGLVQDLADLLQVLADLRESKGLLGHAATLALAGLVSGGLSAYKNWQKAAVKP